MASMSNSVGDRQNYGNIGIRIASNSCPRGRRRIDAYMFLPGLPSPGYFCSCEYWFRSALSRPANDGRRAFSKVGQQLGDDTVAGRSTPLLTSLRNVYPANMSGCLV
jgi:hypothetical protein